MLALFRSRDDLDPLILDASMESESSRGRVVTTSPVETGADVSDHSRNESVRFRFRAYFQDQPPNSLAAQQRANSAQKLEDIVQTLDTTRATTQMAKLFDLADSKQPFIVIAEIEELEDMLFVGDLVTQKKAGKYSAGGVSVPTTIEVNGTCVQVKRASVRFTPGVSVVKTEVPAAQPTKQKGVQAAKPASAETRDGSLSNQILFNGEDSGPPI